MSWPNVEKIFFILFACSGRRSVFQYFYRTALWFFGRNAIDKKSFSRRLVLPAQRVRQTWSIGDGNNCEPDDSWNVRGGHVSDDRRVREMNGNVRGAVIPTNASRRPGVIVNTDVWAVAVRYFRNAALGAQWLQWLDTFSDSSSVATMRTTNSRRGRA